jgi:serine/threonine-protein kinase
VEKIGKYKVLEKIGEGAMGVVYKAHDPVMERVVAIKTMSADLDSEPELRTRFFREAQSAGKLSHKNIITIYELFEEGGRVYIAMEYLDGEELKSKIARRDRLPLEHKIRLMTELCEGLEHAHHKEVIHRDIKPGNIHVTRTGHVKILDFGLARIASSDITRSGSVMGTPNYMSPEQVKGEKVDTRSDIFSAGAVFYELLTFRKPFAGSSYHQTFFKIIDQEPEPPHAIEPSLPEELSNVVMRALAKVPAKRYQHVDELVRDLNRFSKTLDKKRKEIHDETRKAIGALDRFIEKNKEALRQAAVQASDESVRLQSQMDDLDEDTEATKRMDFTLGYFEMLQMRDRANQEREKLGALLESVKQASSLIEEAASLQKNGQLGKALQVVEKLLRNIPNHKEAKALREGLREELVRRAGEEEKRRKVEELVKQAQVDYRRGDFQASLSVLDQALHLDAEHGDAVSLRQKVAGRLEQKRLEEERAHQADELFQKATAKFSDNDPQGCLPLLVEVLKLQPDHLGATMLQEQAQQRIEEIAELEEKRRRAKEALSSAREALDAGDLTHARRQVEQTIELDSQATGAMQIIKDIERAHEEREAREERERQVEKLFGDATSFDESGDEEQALEKLARLLAIAPGHQPAVKLKKEIDQRREAREGAERERQQKIAARLAEAEEAAKSGNLSKAAKLAKELLTEEASHPDARKLSERLETEIAARMAQEAADKKAKAILSEAKALVDRQEYRAAVSLLEKAEPAVAELGSIQTALRDYRTAAKRHQEAVELARRVAELFERGNQAFGASDYTSCAREMQQLLSLQSDHTAGRALHQRAQQKLEEQRERERRARQFADAMRGARKAFAAGELDEAASELETARALEPENPDCRRLKEEIEQRQAQLREQRKKRERSQRLESEARKLVKKGDGDGARKAQQMLSEAVSLWPELPGAPKLQGRIQKEIARAEKKAQAEARRRQKAQAKAVGRDDTLRPKELRAPTTSKSLVVPVAAGLGLVALVAVIWALVSRQPVEQVDLPSSTEADTPAAAESDSAVTAEPDPELARGLATARDFLDRKEFTEAAREAQAVLSLSPGHTEAQGILQSAQGNLATIAAGVKEVQSFVDAGELERAKNSLGKVLALAPSNPEVQSLLGQLNQYFKQSADGAVKQMHVAKSKAEQAQATQLAQELFQQAGRAETVAQALYGQNKFGEATGKFVEAGELYRRAEAEAETEKARVASEQQMIVQRQQADAARQTYQQALDQAGLAGAESSAGFLQAQALAGEAQAKYRRGDFAGARGDFDAASDGMRRAVAAAGADDRAARDRVTAARQALESAKSASPRNAQAQSEESNARAFEQQGNLADAEAAYRRAAALYRSTAASGEADRQAVLSSLQRYEAALEHRNIDELKAVWPGVNESVYRQNFEFARSWQVELEIFELEVSRETATVRCRRRDLLQTVDGQTYSPETDITFILGKPGDTWVITESREAR